MTTQTVRAVASNLPIADLEIYRNQFRTLALLQNKKMRVVYRGPRYDLMRLSTRKKDAVAFSVYFREYTNDHPTGNFNTPT